MQKRRCPEEISQKNGESEKNDGLCKERMKGKTGGKGRGETVENPERPAETPENTGRFFCGKLCGECG